MAEHRPTDPLDDPEFLTALERMEPDDVPPPAWVVEGRPVPWTIPEFVPAPDEPEDHWLSSRFHDRHHHHHPRHLRRRTVARAALAAIGLLTMVGMGAALAAITFSDRVATLLATR